MTLLEIRGLQIQILQLSMNRNSKEQCANTKVHIKCARFFIKKGKTVLNSKNGFYSVFLYLVNAAAVYIWLQHEDASTSIACVFES